MMAQKEKAAKAARLAGAGAGRPRQPAGAQPRAGGGDAAEEGGTACGAPASFQSTRLEPRIERLGRSGSWSASGKRTQASGRTIRRAGSRYGQASAGWMRAGRCRQRRAELEGFAREVEAAGFTHVVHMGMGGSSLAPLVFQHCSSRCRAGSP